MATAATVTRWRQALIALTSLVLRAARRRHPTSTGKELGFRVKGLPEGTKQPSGKPSNPPVPGSGARARSQPLGLLAQVHQVFTQDFLKIIERKRLGP